MSSQSSNAPTELEVSSKSVYPRDNSNGFFYGYQNNTDGALGEFVENAVRHVRLIDNTVDYAGLVDYASLFSSFNFYNNTE